MGSAMINSTKYARAGQAGRMPMRAPVTMGRLLVLAAGCAAALAPAAPASAGQQLRHDPARCAPGAGASVTLTITNVAESRGTLRVQSYRGTREDWLAKGRWLNRIELPARAGTMRVCMPLPGPGTYAIAVRHDRNGNGETDLTQDGGGMSNNPSINALNLGRPSYTKTRFTVPAGPVAMTIRMRYMG